VENCVTVQHFVYIVEMSDHYVDPENVQISGRLSDKRKLSEMEENSVQLKRKLIKMEKDSSQLQYKLSEMEEEEEKLYKQQVSMAGCQSIGLFEFIGLQSSMSFKFLPLVHQPLDVFCASETRGRG